LADVGPWAFVDQCQEEHRHVLGSVVDNDPIPARLALASATEPDLSGATRAGMMSPTRGLAAMVTVISASSASSSPAALASARKVGVWITVCMAVTVMAASSSVKRIVMAASSFGYP
jgi:hypothetical protein